MHKNIMGFLKKIQIKLIKAKNNFKKFISKRPFLFLFALLGVLILVIVLVNFLNKPTPEEEKKEIPKKVNIYQIGEAPKMTLQAQVEKSGVITITALSPGVVQKIYAEPGDIVRKGQTLISTSTNYQGGNTAYLQSQIAKKNLETINSTFDAQKDLIAKQKDIALKTDNNADEIREITKKSLDETSSVIELNNQNIETIDSIIKTLEESGASESSILSAKSQKAQLISGNNSLKQSLRNAQYSSGDENAPADLSNIQKDIALKQLEIQEKTLEMNREIARLQLSITQVQAATMYPSSPFNATVQRVLVKAGEVVAPGTPLIILSQEIEEDPIVAIAYVSQDVALQTSMTSPSKLFLKDIAYETFPSYISRDAVEGSLYAIYYPIPDEYHQKVTDTGYINIEIPIAPKVTNAAIPFLPIDSVYQTQDEAYVFLSKDNVAVSQKIQLGSVTGKYVEVKSGLQQGDKIILDRNIFGGEIVTER